jgi:hypothetical protein
MESKEENIFMILGTALSMLIFGNITKSSIIY